MSLHPIDPNQSTPIRNTSETKSTTDKNLHIREKNSISESPGKDRVTLSNRREDYEAIQKAAKQLPDVRQEKVEQLRKAIEAGEYHVSNEDLADQLIHETIINHGSN